MKKLFGISVLVLWINLHVAQPSTIDSLKKALVSASVDSTRCDIWREILKESDDRKEKEKANDQIKSICLKHLKNTGVARIPYVKHYINALIFEAETLENTGFVNEAFVKYDQAIKLSKEIKYEKKTAIILNSIGYMFQSKGDSPKALEYFEKALEVCERNEIEAGIPSTLNNIAIVYVDLGDVPRALDYYNKALNYREALLKKDPSDGKKKSLANSLTNIASVYAKQGEKVKAVELFQKAIKLQKEANDKYGEATALSNMATVYDDEKDKTMVLEMHAQALKLREEIEDLEGVANTEGNIGVVYFDNNEYKESLSHFLRALEIRTSIGDKGGVCITNNYLANVYLKTGEEGKAREFAIKSLAAAKELGYPFEISEASYTLYEILQTSGNYKEALSYYKDYVKMRDSTNNEQTKRATLRQQAKYEFQQIKAIEDARHQVEIEKQKELSRAERNRQNTIIASVSVVLLLVAFFSVSLYRRFKVTQKQKAIIEQKERETLRQKYIIEEKHKEITDSINYAERIQRSFLATKEQLDEHLNVSSRHDAQRDSASTRNGSVTSSGVEKSGNGNDVIGFDSARPDNYFILFKPKDVVSGDFYWSAMLNNGHFALVTADSTGHGVPGAIMSLLNITSLEKAIETETSPDKVLNATRKTIIERLKKDGSIDGGKDGMDCSFLSFNKDKTKLQIAAAHNPVWIMRSTLRGVPKDFGTTKQTEDEIASLSASARNDVEVFDINANLFDIGVEVIEVKADKMPVGKHDRQDVPFTLYEIDLQKGDVIYTLTDGFPDQFGGPMGKKFMSKKLRELLRRVCHKPLNEQKHILEKAFIDWVGELEQIDDVTVIGIRV